MRYRTRIAQNFHSSLMALIRDHSSEQKKTDVETSASQLDFESITELSINGHSHLMDALHLPFEIITDKEQASRVANYLMGLLMSKAKTISRALNCLLLQKNVAGFTPLHQALKSGNVQNMQAYFTEVRVAVSNNLITQAEYKQLLIGATHAGFTPLHAALISGNAQNMQAYCTEVRVAVRNNLITQAEYKQLLIGATHAGFTPLHEALISGNAENMQAYFKEVREAVSNNLITQAEYKQLLIGANHAGFTPLHQAANSGSYPIYEAYMTALIPLGQYVMDEVLFSKTKAGHLPSCQCGKSDSAQINAALNEIRSQFRPAADAVAQQRGYNDNHAKRARSPRLFGGDRRLSEEQTGAPSHRSFRR